MVTWSPLGVVQMRFEWVKLMGFLTYLRPKTVFLQAAYGSMPVNTNEKF